jgi:hypothetical protein
MLFLCVYVCVKKKAARDCGCQAKQMNIGERGGIANTVASYVRSITPRG